MSKFFPTERPDLYLVGLVGEWVNKAGWHCPESIPAVSRSEFFAARGDQSDPWGFRWRWCDGMGTRIDRTFYQSGIILAVFSKFSMYRNKSTGKCIKKPLLSKGNPTPIWSPSLFVVRGSLLVDRPSSFVVFVVVLVVVVVVVLVVAVVVVAVAVVVVVVVPVVVPVVPTRRLWVIFCQPVLSGFVWSAQIEQSCLVLIVFLPNRNLKGFTTWNGNAKRVQFPKNSGEHAWLALLLLYSTYLLFQPIYLGVSPRE